MKTILSLLCISVLWGADDNVRGFDKKTPEELQAKYAIKLPLTLEELPARVNGNVPDKLCGSYFKFRGSPDGRNVANGVAAFVVTGGTLSETIYKSWSDKDGGKTTHHFNVPTPQPAVAIEAGVYDGGVVVSYSGKSKFLIQSTNNPEIVAVSKISGINIGPPTAFMVKK